MPRSLYKVLFDKLSFLCGVERDQKSGKKVMYCLNGFLSIKKILSQNITKTNRWEVEEQVSKLHLTKIFRKKKIGVFGGDQTNDGLFTKLVLQASNDVGNFDSGNTSRTPEQDVERFFWHCLTQRLWEHKVCLATFDYGVSWTNTHHLSNFVKFVIGKRT